MNSKLREKYISNLADSATAIMKKLAAGQSVTANECLFLRVFQRELKAYEYVPPADKLLQNADKILSFAKDNLSGILSLIPEV